MNSSLIILKHDGYLTRYLVTVNSDSTFHNLSIHVLRCWFAKFELPSMKYLVGGFDIDVVTQQGREGVVAAGSDGKGVRE